VGKRAMLIVTAGGWRSITAPRGQWIDDDLPVPDQSGILIIPLRRASAVLVYRVDRPDEAGFEPICRAPARGGCGRSRITADPIDNRMAGDYLIPSMQLRPTWAIGCDRLRASQEAQRRPSRASR